MCVYVNAHTHLFVPSEMFLGQGKAKGVPENRNELSVALVFFFFFFPKLRYNRHAALYLLQVCT